ncbi:hypothetical protein GCM10010832_06240 [Psychroflexus planctonicus]|uniref:Uncharacterized protein n=1 Tax=Psychroflexus planctonicus TaxID=1526575 RepID=A0ABQ1SG10_9FLAO|nr:hypothetical protein GCM10010832_06240 [Psychroflexus planctonicus]
MARRQQNNGCPKRDYVCLLKQMFILKWIANVMTQINLDMGFVFILQYQEILDKS